MRTSNPVFSSIERSATYSDASAATYQGITVKTLGLFLLAALSGYISLSYITIENFVGFMFGSLIVAFIAVIIGTRSVRFAMPAALIYAAAEGSILGFFTVIAEAYVPGAATAAIVATGAVFFVMLFLYSSRIIRVTSRFRKMMYTILFGLLFFFILNGIFQLITGTSFLYDENGFSTLALSLTVFMIVYGAFMLTLDFDRAEAIVSSGADKRYEWIISIGLMVTIIWIYIEILRLILIVSRNR